MHIKPDTEGVEALRELYVGAIVATKLIHASEPDDLWAFWGTSTFTPVVGWKRGPVRERGRVWHWPHTSIGQVQAEYDILVEEGIL